ncbi:MAG: DUF4041 domain-containing protein [Desulfovibrionaceae bacterium]|nr:DUF4041 domain-containing protein [Desulfovibrionaceae bacterium]
MRKFFSWLLIVLGVLLALASFVPTENPQAAEGDKTALVVGLLLAGAGIMWRRKRSTGKGPKGGREKTVAAPAYAAVDEPEAQAREKADQIIREAKQEAAAIVAAAKKQGKGGKAGGAPVLQGSPEEVLLIAREEAASILKAAHKQAEEIAGEFHAKVRENLDYEKAIKAMRNVLEGYGDEYLLPARSILDDLAESFSFEQAGQALKEARHYSRDLVKQGNAATCDYVEDYRKNTAIAFIVDAFNGKVDTILSSVRQDNIGKLQQAIKDAFSLVNINGKAFRDARILPEYLAARLEEAKWGCAVVELREKAREEQRAIKERMREEERARREYEKALREAAKEEESLQAALKKAQEEASAQQISEAQKALLESRIAALQGRLAEAEEKARRAESMASLTRSGHVYILSNTGSFGEKVFKIGMTRRLEPLDRVKELGDASVPFAFDVHGMIYSEDAVKLEADLHRIFNPQRLNKVNSRKEFFTVDMEQVQKAVGALGYKVQLTMLAEAKEYLESKAFDNLSAGERDNILARILEEETANKDMPEEDTVEA